MEQENELIECLKAIPWFQSISEKHLLMIAAITKIVTADRGELLFEQGDKQENLYVLVEGRISVELYSPECGNLRIFTAEPLDVVGFSSVTHVVRQRTASARAIEDSCLIAMDAVGLNRLCEQDHEFGYIVLRRLANIAASRTKIARSQMVDMVANPIGKDQSA